MGFFKKDLCMVLPSEDTIKKANLLPVYFERNIHFIGTSTKNPKNLAPTSLS